MKPTNGIKKKVLHITLDMSIGGTQQVIKNLILEMNQPTIEHSVLCLDGVMGDFGKDLVEKGVAVHVMSRNKRGYDLQLIRDLSVYIKKNNIDIIHCHQYTPWFYGTLACLFQRKFLIFTEHGRFFPDIKNWKHRFINKLLLLKTNKVTAISEATKTALYENEYINLSRIDVIYNGIKDLTHENFDLDSLGKELKRDSNTHILGTVARLDPIKNHKMMLKAFKLALNQMPDLILVVVGDGEIRSDLEQYTKELEIENRVIFTGYKINPHIYIKLFDVFLLSSLSEGTSMTLLEAMSLSKPCIVTDAGGNKEIIQDHVNGFVTKNDNVTEFSEAIVRLLTDRALIQKMGVDARRIFDSKFSVNNMNSAYFSIYKSFV